MSLTLSTLDKLQLILGWLESIISYINKPADIMGTINFFSITKLPFTLSTNLAGSFSEGKWMQTRQCQKKKIEFKNCNSHFTFMQFAEIGLVSAEPIICKFEIGTMAVVNDKALVVYVLLKTSIFLLANAHQETCLDLQLSIIKFCNRFVNASKFK